MLYCSICHIGSDFGHTETCPRSPMRRKAFMAYPEGIGDVRFHRFDGETVVIKRVAFDTVSGVGSNARTVSGDFENGNPFHVPECAWWEVIYD